MKRILPLIALTLFSSTAALSQTPCPVTRIDDCPNEGCAAWDRQLNLRKNRVSGSGGTPKVMTLEEIRRLPYPVEWHPGKDRRELDALGEGQLIEVTAYLIDVRDGELSSANCKLAEMRSVNKIKSVISLNDVLVLVSRETLNRPAGRQREAESIVAEITPRGRAAHSTLEGENQITNWTTKKLRLLIKQSDRKPVLVRVTGWLLLDTEAVGNAITRYTDWEIHPVSDISVCPRADGCPNDREWQKLDKVIIKSRPPAARTSRIPPPTRLKPRR
jgi:hypothetical protein